MRTGRSDRHVEGQGGLFDLFENVSPVPGRPAEATAHRDVDGATPRPASDFRLQGERALARGWRSRALDNIAALALAKDLAGRNALPDCEQQLTLAKFTGFGASDLANGAFRGPDGSCRKGWEDVAETLAATVTPDELASLCKATQYAHYTPEGVARAMWQAVESLGFRGGDILEPGCGVGIFLATAPARITQSSTFTGIDDDPSSIAICRLLYPASHFILEDYCKSIADKPCDLVIGNPPYSDRAVRNRTPLGKLGLSLHDHFIVRSTRGLRPGGLAAFLTSRYTMDRQDSAVRRLLAADHDLVAAVRLPNGCMRQAGTDVLADVIILRRRLDGEHAEDATWIETGEAIPASGGEAAVYVNRWFLDRPRSVLGEHVVTSSQFGPAYGCRAEPGVDIARLLAAQLAVAIGAYAGGSRHVRTGHTGATSAPLFQSAGSRPTQPDAPSPLADLGRPIPLETIPDGPGRRHLRDGSYVVHAGRLMQVRGGCAERVVLRSRRTPTGMPSTHETLIRLLIPIRDRMREVLDLQLADLPWANAQADLDRAYQMFRDRAGRPINDTVHVETTDPKTGELREWSRRPVINAFKQDPDCFLVCSIEAYDAEANQGVRGRIFTQRIVGPPAVPGDLDPADALPVCLRDLGRVDMKRIADLSGGTEDEVAVALGDRVFLDPSDRCWTTSDEYLSGAVKSKLRAAEAAAAADPSFTRNVDALTAVQPRQLQPSEITIDLGAPWIEADDIADFTEETFDLRLRIDHRPTIGSWSVTVPGSGPNATMTTKWGTDRRHAGALLEDALNSRSPKIMDTVYDEDGRELQVVNQAETEAARAKIDEMRATFARWAWRDPERSVRLVEEYNERFNNLVQRTFDGSHLTMDQSSLAIRFYEKQKRAIWRIVSSGSTYLAHFMGAGKTAVLIGAIMEQRRLGLVRKPLLVVPNHVLEQVATEFMHIYPLARILVADEDDMSRKNRLRFFAKATTGDWDCIVVTHSAFGFIPVSKEFEAVMQERMRDRYVAAISMGEADTPTTKRMEKKKEQITQRIEALRSVKDDMVTIEMIGIDQILVDESHEFRKLSFATNQDNIKGIDPQGSQRAWDLYTKIKCVRRINPGRECVLSSGTPIANTLAELFTAQRYLDEDALIERQVDDFDAWAATFGRMKTELELQPDGRYKRVSRFAEFVNIPELTGMFRQFADVVLEEELKEYLVLPRLRTGGRQIVTCPPTPAFKRGLAKLGERIKVIANRKGRPQKGSDIILSVIGDGRLLAIDPRTLDPAEPNEEQTKLNELVRRAHAIWLRDRDKVYTDPFSGCPMPIKGSTQMIFSDIAVRPSERRGGFSAYHWIKAELVRLGVPASRIAFIQDFKTAAARRGAFKAMVSGSLQIMIGSTQGMGTGANAQARLAALHHLDQPYLVSSVSQREFRMIRQGNQNEEVDLLGYVTEGSMDATVWQFLKRKAAFINAAMKGDPRVRRMDEDDDQVASFAYARAMASGDVRLMRKAELEADIGRLQRLRTAHVDGLFANTRRLAGLHDRQQRLIRQIEGARLDVAHRDRNRSDVVATIGRTEHRKSPEAKIAIKDAVAAARSREVQATWKFGTIQGFEIEACGELLTMWDRSRTYMLTFKLLRHAGKAKIVSYNDNDTVGGLLTRLENALDAIEDELAQNERELKAVTATIADYEGSQHAPFEFETQLSDLLAEDKALDEELADETPAMQTQHNGSPCDPRRTDSAPAPIDEDAETVDIEPDLEVLAVLAA